MQNPSDRRHHLFDNPNNTKRVLYALYGLCAVLLAVDFFYHRHISHPWEPLWGFYGLFGFTACIVLVLVAKFMRKLLMRRDDYYDAD